MKWAISWILSPHVSALKTAEHSIFRGFSLFFLGFVGSGMTLAVIGLILGKLPESVLSKVLLAGLEIFGGFFLFLLFAEFAAVFSFGIGAENTPLSKLKFRLSGDGK